MKAPGTNLSNSRWVIGTVALIVVATAGTATAAKLINSGDVKDDSLRFVDVKNNSLRSADVRNGSLRVTDLSGNTVRKLRAYEGAHWGIVDRNVLGNGDSYLRAGPDGAPSGIGSLGIRTGSADDKAAFGNQVDFAGLLVKDLTEVGFSVYTTAENNARGNNMPSISFEIDPNVETVVSNYSSLVYMPPNGTSNAWTRFDATTTGFWGLTGSSFNGTPCSINGARCTFAEMQAYLNDGGDDAVITFSAQITKGRDLAFSGAVDDLTINDTTYNFEPLGVIATTTP